MGEKCVDNGKEFNLACAVKAKTITSGLKYSLATVLETGAKQIW